MCGPLIEKIVAICQTANEANKWVDLLSAHSGAGDPRRPATELKRNVSSSAVNIPQPPPHVSDDFFFFFKLLSSFFFPVVSIVCTKNN